MTPPADFTALRALVEALDQSGIKCLATIHQLCIHDLVATAREALERVEAEHRSCVTQFAYDAVCGGNAKQAARLSALRRDAETFTARLARLEGALARERGCSECWHGTSCGTDCRMNDLLKDQPTLELRARKPR